MTSPAGTSVLSVMLAVEDTPTAVAWYQRALGATLLWNLGSVAGLEIEGAAFFLGEPARNGWESPTKLGITSVRPGALVFRRCHRVGDPVQIFE